MSQFTFTIDDPDSLISSKLHADIERCATYVIELVDRYIDWKGVLDVEVEIRAGSDLTWSDANGLMPALGQISWDGAAWTNDTLTECLTGVDTDANRPDSGCTIYLGDDGKLRNYGEPLWFDPDPKFGRDPGVPEGTHDFTGVFTHEVFHTLGFYAATSQWQDKVEKIGGDYYFVGKQTTALLGEPLMLQPSNEGGGSGTDHYGNTASDVNNVPRGLMFQWGNYASNRLDIGRIDLAVLADLGHDVHDFDGLPLFELQDTDPSVSGTGAGETLFGDYHANVIQGKGGNDTLQGWSGKDRLLGGNGNDWLHGGAAGDILIGAAGKDRFVFDSDIAAGGNVDSIRDFASGVDRILLHEDIFDVDIGATKSGTALTGSMFRLGKTASDGNDHIIYEKKTGRLFYDSDGRGGEDQVQFALFASAKHPDLSASDFLIFA
jgi:hypothetical protein